MSEFSAKLIIDGSTEKDVRDVIATVAESSNVTLRTSTVSNNWPPMEFGDEFNYGGVAFVFIKYERDFAARCISKEALFGDSAISPSYFDTRNMIK